MPIEFCVGSAHDLGHVHAASALSVISPNVGQPCTGLC